MTSSFALASGKLLVDRQKSAYAFPSCSGVSWTRTEQRAPCVPVIFTILAAVIHQQTPCLLYFIAHFFLNLAFRINREWEWDFHLSPFFAVNLNECQLFVGAVIYCGRQLVIGVRNVTKEIGKYLLRRFVLKAWAVLVLRKPRFVFFYNSNIR